MEIRPYPVSSYKGKKNTFRFISRGTKNVLKIVELQETDSPGIYSLAMGDQVAPGRISYSNITDNKDTDMVMQTVGHIVELFTEANPQRYIFVRGDTPVKTRLYQIYLSNNLEKVQEQFKVWGGNEDGTGFEPFKKGKNYGGFLVKRL